VTGPVLVAASLASMAAAFSTCAWDGHRGPQVPTWTEPPRRGAGRKVWSRTLSACPAEPWPQPARTAAGATVGRAGAAGGRRKDPVAAAAAGLRGFERKGGRQGGSVTLRVEGHQTTLLRMRLTQADQQQGELTTRCSC